MPTSFPRSVREAWGEEATEDFARWFEESLRERAVPRDEYREVLSRLDVVEQRMDGLEQRMDGLGQRMDRLEDTIEARFAQVDQRFDQMHEAMRVQTRWTVGAIVAIGAILSALLSIAEFAA